MNKRLLGKATLLGALAGVMCCTGCAVAANDEPGPEVNARAAVVRLAADQIEAALSAVAASSGAVAREFALAHRAMAENLPGLGDEWNGRYLASGKTILFQSWDGPLEPQPGFQSEVPAYYAYRGEPLDQTIYRQLEVFRRLTPAVRAAHGSFPYAWSYVTTADDMMLLYPFLTLDEAVNNQVPTDQTFYRSADFANRSAGWTPPYLDLVGAGMMVTVSTPAYDGDTLLGVVSHDITLSQLSHSVLEMVARDAGGTAWLVDESGLVIAVSDPALQKELDQVNLEAGRAVLHYRHPGALPLAGGDPARASQTSWINEATEAVLSQARARPGGAGVQVAVGRNEVMATRLQVTKWLFLWSTSS